MDMSELEMNDDVETEEEFTDEMSDEALDEESVKICICCGHCKQR
jgi:hypothetical protein